MESKPKIVVVEDEVLVRMFAVDVLEDEGFEVIECSNAAEASQRFQGDSNGIVAAIIDVGLPDRPGDQLASDLRASHTDLPILIASGRSERELKERLGTDHRMGIIVKPFTGSMLLEALEQIGVNPRSP